ncbi:MAG TPA: hypothetical protein VLA37_11600, partial [Sphingomonadaceae bacterium]|nr:hypothetical protein [Sphingomonadaceae bacterium]
MELALAELPGDLFHAALLAFRAQLAATDDQSAELAETNLRQSYDESRTRLTVIARLVASMGDRANSSLSIEQAGAALFLSALALGSGQDRDLAVLAASHRQAFRLALSLRAAGLEPRLVEEQFLVLQPETALPFGFEELSAERAAALLAHAGEATED